MLLEFRHPMKISNCYPFGFALNPNCCPMRLNIGRRIFRAIEFLEVFEADSVDDFPKFCKIHSRKPGPVPKQLIFLWVFAIDEDYLLAKMSAAIDEHSPVRGINAEPRIETGRDYVAFAERAFHGHFPNGLGIPSCLQISRTKNGSISGWRGTVLQLRFVGLKTRVCLAPSMIRHPSFPRYFKNFRRFNFSPRLGHEFARE